MTSWSQRAMRFSLDLTPAEHTRLHALANRAGLSMAQLLRDAIYAADGERSPMSVADRLRAMADELEAAPRGSGPTCPGE